MTTTLTNIRVALAAMGIVIKKTSEGDYRVNFRNGDEATAYYTNDLDDAFNTGKVMANRAAVRRNIAL